MQLTDGLGIFAPEPTNGFERQFVGFEIAHERAAENCSFQRACMRCLDLIGDSSCLCGEKFPADVQVRWLIFGL